MSFFDGLAHEEFVWAKIEKSIWLSGELGSYLLILFPSS
jgi:hypothetical protein